VAPRSGSAGRQTACMCGPPPNMATRTPDAPARLDEMAARSADVGAGSLDVDSRTPHVDAWDASHGPANQSKDGASALSSLHSTSTLHADAP
jgi:hypothetical protein